jgi:hypothetical protein
VNKAQFLQEKSAFHMTYPDKSDLAFYRWFVERHPDLAIGWYHLGREREMRNEIDEALAAYRQALHAKHGPYSEEAAAAYQDLLRKRRRRLWAGRIRLLLASLLFFHAQFAFSPGLLSEPDKAASTGAAFTNGKNASGQERPHVEVIAVPAGTDGKQLRHHVYDYVSGRRTALKQPYTVLVVPEVTGAPLFTPLLFYRPGELHGLLRYDPVSRTVLSQQWFDRPCACDQHPAVRTAKLQLAEEQRTLEHLLILRSALYRHYQRKGSLPQKLSDLARSYPGNALPDIPPTPAWYGATDWAYQPAAFRREAAWESMRHVVPLRGYPEPSVPLAPLQIHVHLDSHAMTLISGPHLVRRYPIAIGKNGSTPAGYFSVLQKISNPRGPDDIYGTRGLIFQQNGYAIHGTNHPASIGQSVSLGCIRLHNRDVEELYTFVAPGTEVIISAHAAPVPRWANPAAFVLPAGRDEETPRVVYHWLH